VTGCTFCILSYYYINSLFTLKNKKFGGKQSELVLGLSLRRPYSLESYLGGVVKKQHPLIAK
jgi:hypothetical protein